MSVWAFRVFTSARRLAAVCVLCALAGSAAPQESETALADLENAISAGEEDFSSEDAYHIGRAAAAHILQRYRLYTANPTLTAYLNLICGALAVNSPAPDWYNGYHVEVLDSPVLNAFSTPGGHIFITRGMAAAAVSEDMLAAIIAHELAHIQLEHGIEKIKHIRLVQDLQNTSNTAARIALREASVAERSMVFQESVSGMVNVLFQNGYSQLQELDADAWALSLLSAAGYDPQSLVELFRLLERGQANQAGGFDTTHPLPLQRIAAVEKDLEKYPAPATRSFRQKRFTRVMNQGR
jgi:predicted Zn-dependent protease